jgi:hypothetical protein
LTHIWRGIKAFLSGEVIESSRKSFGLWSLRFLLPERLIVINVYNVNHVYRQRDYRKSSVLSPEQKLEKSVGVTMRRKGSVIEEELISFRSSDGAGFDVLRLRAARQEVATILGKP